MTDELVRRRLERLHHELVDDGVRLPDDADLLTLLLTEVDYARHPHAHEGVGPVYGALLAEPGSLREHDAMQLELVDIDAIPLAVARRLADGRSSFVARLAGAGSRLVCFERTREYESSAVHLATSTGAIVVQRLGGGWVRLTTPDGVATWDGIRWSTRPLFGELVGRLTPDAPGANQVVLANILELCAHWLAAGRVGATLVWALDGDPLELHHLGMQAAVEVPVLELQHRAHFAALLNALSQYDRAALVAPDGRVHRVGVNLRASERTRQEIPPLRGTRHTSALRFSADEPSTIVFVVSSSGTLTVFRHGRRLDTD